MRWSRRGATVPFGFDKASGDQVSIADFTAYAEKGTGYTLRVGKDVSHAFDIRDDLYGKLKYDALAFFYQQRSGIPIEMPTRAASSGCARPATSTSSRTSATRRCRARPNAGCTYTLDVSGGWYDAGDHGKYVVNAGHLGLDAAQLVGARPRVRRHRPTSPTGR